MVNYQKDFFPVHREKGAYSGNPRNLTAEFDEYVEPDPDDPEIWLNEERFEDDFKIHVDNILQTKLKDIDFSNRTYYACGQSHIDVAWKWRYWQTFRKAVITYRKAVWHVNHLPNYAFAASQPQLLDWIRHEDPGLFEDIKTAVKTGRFDLVGGMWAEPDCHIPSGEAFCRQRLLGQRFYLEHFGKTSDIEWVPDSFGFASTLPQIILKSGSHYFFTTKLCGNRYTQFPFVNFLWESPDGSQVLAALTPGGYGSFTGHEKFDPIRRLLAPGKELRAEYSLDAPESMDVYAEELPPIPIFDGKGDGGHGPTGEEVALLDAFAERGIVTWMPATQYFEEILEKYRDRLPVWTDELYYEFHRGTITTHLLIKRLNRYFEWRLVAVEKLVMIIAAFADIDVTSWMDQLAVAWKLLALDQFHDVLPGSSVPEVYDDVYDIAEYSKTLIDEVERDAWTALLGQHEENMLASEQAVLFKATGYDVKDVLLEMPFNGETVPETATANNDTSPVQLLEADDFGLDPLFISRPRRLLFRLSASQHSLNAVVFGNEAKLAQRSTILAEELDDEIMLDNEFYTLRISKGSGNITSILFKPLDQEMLAAPGAQLNVFFDWFTDEQAWNILPGYRTMPVDLAPPSRVSIVENGPLRWTAEIERDFFNDGTESNENETSRVLQRVSIIKSAPGIYIDFLVDWHCCEAIAKLDVHLASLADQVISEVPYGTIKRATNPVANHDVPRWENYNHTWLDAPSKDGEWGVAFINKGRYGHDNKDNRIGLTLIRGPLYPPPAGEAWVIKERQDRFKDTRERPPAHSDLGPQLIQYIIVPHEGSWERSAPFIPAMAHWFNEGYQMTALPISSTFDATGKSLAWVEGNNAEIGAIKLAEERNGRVVRVVESAGTGGDVTVCFHPALKVKNAVETDILERPLSEQVVEVEKDDRGEFVSKLLYRAKPHEIKTFLIE